MYACVCVDVRVCGGCVCVCEREGGEQCHVMRLTDCLKLSDYQPIKVGQILELG